MGIEAVVFKHRRNINLNLEIIGALIDEPYGEVYFHNPSFANQYPKDLFIAIQKIIGNATMIVSLNNEISTILGSKSLLCERVLYEGSRCGDFIELEMMDNLKKEINLINKTNGTVSVALLAFLKEMEELIEAAKEQSNPIVFTGYYGR